MRFRILASGSSGNCALILTEQARVLIDAGLSARRVQKLLAEDGESLDRVDAILISHEHGDHCSGLDGLRRYPGIVVYANESTARQVQKTLDYNPAWSIFETGSTFRHRDLEICTFPVPHDAVDPVGFRFSSGHPDDLFSPCRSLGWVTDLGHAPQKVRDQIRECDVLVVESNHCPRLLEADHRRSWSLKQRISGRHGHLSNEAAVELLSSVASPRWRRIYLAHLSRDCNTPAAVETAMAPVRQALGCELSIVGHGEGTSLYEIL